MLLNFTFRPRFVAPLIGVTLLAVGVQTSWAQAVIPPNEPLPPVWKGHRTMGPNDWELIRRRVNIGDEYSIAVQKMRQYISEKRFADAGVEFQKTVALDRESAPFNEWGDALEAQGDVDGAIAAYRQIVYHREDLRPESVRRQHPLAPRDFIDENGQSIRAIAYQTGPEWYASRANDATLLLRYALLLQRAGKNKEAFQAFEWGFQGRSTDGQLPALDKFFDLKPTMQPVERSHTEAMAHIVMGRLQYDARTREETLMPANTMIAECLKALAIEPNNNVARIFLGVAYKDKLEFYPEYRDKAIAEWKTAVRDPNPTVQEVAKKLLAAL